MKAGVDFGTSLKKAFWKKDGIGYFASSAADGVPALAARLSEAGVTEINALGIGKRDGFEGFTLREPDGEPLAAEVSQQASGVRLLPSGKGLPDRFTLVSIGTGTSYVDVVGENVVCTHIGSAMGGGFIAGMGRLFLIGDPMRIGTLAEKGTPPDTLMKHCLPALDGTPMGELVISFFNRADVSMSDEDFSAGLVHCVAASVVCDLMKMDRDGVDRSNVAFIGSPVRVYPTLRTYLEYYGAMLGKTVHFPTQGEFAGAIGAHHRDE